MTRVCVLVWVLVLHSEQRPHVIYSSYEYRLGLPPIIVGALSNLYLDKYAPLAGYCSHLADLTVKQEGSAFSPSAEASKDGPSTAASKRSNGTTPSSANSRSAVKLEVDYNKMSSVKIGAQKAPVSVLQRLMDELKILILKGKVGYDGEMNEDGERHGKGIYTYPNGEKYIGKETNRYTPCPVPNAAIYDSCLCLQLVWNILSLSRDR
jgi:hypothetical protein